MKKINLLFVYCAVFGSCTKAPDNLQTLNQPTDSLILSVTKNDVPADNYSYAEITAAIIKRRTVSVVIVFSTDKGLFSNNSTTYSATLSGDNTIKVYLKYYKQEIARVTANIFNNNAKEVVVTFLPAYPSQILISPDSSTLLPSFLSKTLVTADLIRQPGNPSKGQLINFYDSTASSPSRSIGIFLNNNYSDSTGRATVQYCLQDTSYHGFVYVKGYVNTDTGVVIGMNKLYIK